MQNIIEPYEVTKDPWFPPLISPKSFPTDFSGLLAWDGEVPTFTPPYEIESTLHISGYHSEDLVEALGYAVQKQIHDFFDNYQPDSNKYINTTVSLALAGHRSALTKAQKTRAAAIKIKNEILQCNVWRTTRTYFNVNALTLSSEERVSLFAADVSTENEITLRGRGRYTYEQFLISLTTAYAEIVLRNALLAVEKIYEESEAMITAAQISENTAVIIESANTIKIPASSTVQFSTAVGTILINSADGIDLERAIKNGIGHLASLGETVLSRAFAVGIGALLYSPSLGNGERYPDTALSLPLETLDPQPRWNLEEVATREGTIPLRHRILAGENNYSIVSTPPQGKAPSEVPVRALTYNAATNSYFSFSEDSPCIALSFPFHRPEDQSTKLPGNPVERPTYDGLTLSPVVITPTSFPAVDPIDFRDCVYCFPAETGLPPIYIVFNRPYGGTAKGKYSGRWYQPDKAGGPTVSLDWRNATITQEGIELVKLHTGRFGPSAANNVMIERLVKILNGELNAEAIDKKFYTHEIRELERYRKVGVPDGVTQEDDGVTWNNTHTATLEDFGLQDSADQFYTQHAQDAEAQNQSTD